MDDNMTDKKTGILLLSHGSRLPEGEEVIKAYKEMYLEEFPEAIVEYGFMEIRKPGIPETIKKLTEQADLEPVILPETTILSTKTSESLSRLLKVPITAAIPSKSPDTSH